MDQGDVNRHMAALMENINLMADDPDKNLVMIMKDGKVFNNTL